MGSKNPKNPKNAKRKMEHYLWNQFSDFSSREFPGNYGMDRELQLLENLSVFELLHPLIFRPGNCNSQERKIRKIKMG